MLVASGQPTVFPSKTHVIPTATRHHVPVPTTAFGMAMFAAAAQHCATLTPTLLLVMLTTRVVGRHHALHSGRAQTSAHCKRRIVLSQMLV